jgi:hypothetical protein
VTLRAPPRRELSPAFIQFDADDPLGVVVLA